MARPRPLERVAQFERLHDLQSWEILFAICACGHYKHIDHASLKRRHGGAAVLRELEPRLRCSGCRERGKARFCVRPMER